MIEVKKDAFAEEIQQVLYWDEDSGHYRPGLMFHFYVFCSCCGKKMLIEELFEAAAEYKETNGLDFDIKPVLVFDDWTDFTWGMISIEDIYEMLAQNYTIKQQEIFFQ